MLRFEVITLTINQHVCFLFLAAISAQNPGLNAQFDGNPPVASVVMVFAGLFEGWVDLGRQPGNHVPEILLHFCTYCTIGRFVLTTTPDGTTQTVAT